MAGSFNELSSANLKGLSIISIDFGCFIFSIFDVYSAAVEYSISSIVFENSAIQGSSFTQNNHISWGKYLFLISCSSMGLLLD